MRNGIGLEFFNRKTGEKVIAFAMHDDSSVVTIPLGRFWERMTEDVTGCWPVTEFDKLFGRVKKYG